jgi:hypothetical protein
MRVRHDKQRFSVAAVLLCLVAGFAVSPPEYLRTNVSQRTRACRTVRLDDHDLDHALDVASLSSDLSGIPIEDLPFGVAVLPVVRSFSRPEWPPGILSAAPAVHIFNPSLQIRSGRPPPAA